ncbi:hypothetical protein HF086_014275 [Spodoptera exigua]|uniref:FLYWCH-type domain-containing protein n=1 Tax=Spodoptera exigua TaxID=7107 RepID=A0A922SBJ1_SPOEX|nr:hypothetical protein HF086_014275 [Spodoptera exigua]
MTRCLKLERATWTEENGRSYLYYEGYRYRINNRSGYKVWWICTQRAAKNCSGSLVSFNGKVFKKSGHTH